MTDPIWLLFRSEPAGVGLRISANELAPLLATVGRQLESAKGGTRFPTLWEALRPLTRDDADPVSPSALLAELETLEQELDAVPAGAVPIFEFGDEGYPEIYARESPHATGTARQRFQRVLAALKTFLTASTEATIAPRREGPRVEW